MTPNDIPKITLNDGVQMPVLGFGVYQIPSDQTEQAVTDALAAGYRLLDTAESYGNEEAVGRAIAQSGVPRDELFVTTKLWIHSGEQAAKRAFRKVAWTTRARPRRPIPDPPAARRLLRSVARDAGAEPRGGREGDRRVELLP